MRKKNVVYSFLVVTLLAGLAACSSGLQNATPEVTEKSSLSTQATTVTRTVPDVESDAEEQSNGVYYNNSDVLEFGEKDLPQQTGLRFTGITIPKGATITSARLEFVAVTDSSGSGSLTIRGDKEANAPKFTSSYPRISARPKTTAVANWSPSIWKSGNTHGTANFSNVVQELVNQPSWASGNAMAFVIAGTGQRKASSYDGNSANAPKLIVTYDAPPLPSTSCLDSSSGKLFEFHGIYTTQQRVRDQNVAVRVDAHGGKFLHKVRDLEGVSFLGASNKGPFCLSGGTYNVGLPLNASWRDVKNPNGSIKELNYHGALSLYFSNTPNITVEEVAVENTGDGVAFKEGTDDWVFRASYVKRAGDDGIENDHFSNGTVEDVLIDSAFSGVSCQQEGVRSKRANVTIQNSLIALRDSPTYSHNNFFKMLHATKGRTSDGKNSNCKWYLKDNVILLEHYRSSDYMNPNGSRDGGILIEDKPLQESACVGHKNTIVYVGGIKADFERLKKASPTCYNVTDQVKVWNDARTAWFNNHPEFTKYR